MFCPRCRAEYREGFTQCCDCLVRLVWVLPPKLAREPEAEYVTVMETGNPALLAVAKSLLRDTGTDYLAVGEVPQVAGSVRISVQREDEVHARELLRDLLDSPAEPGFPGEGEAEETPPPTRRKLRFLGAAIVIVGVTLSLLELHRTGTAGWRYGDLAARYVERSLDLEAALASQPPIVRRLFDPSQRPEAETAAWVTGVYGKALSFLDQHDYPETREQAAMVRARLASTLAEFGQRDAAAQSLRALVRPAQGNERIEGLIARISESYALGLPAPGGDARTAELPAGWSADVLEARWAQLAGGLSWAASCQERIRERGAAALRWVLVSTVMHFLLIAGGLLGLLWLLRDRPVLPPLRTPWTLWAGVWVVLLAYFWRHAAGLAVRFLRLPRRAELAVWALAILTLPVFLLVRRRLLEPAGTSARLAFGLEGWARRGGTLALWASVIYAVAALGNEGITYLLTRLGSYEWTVYLDEDVIFGSPFEAAVIGAVSVIIGPVVEEVTFRGVLYGSLRNRLSALPAAALSSAAFAATHPYEPASLVGIVLTGVVLCFAYERTRSLVPPILGHALFNTVLSFKELAMFR